MSQIRVGQDVFDVGLSVARAEQSDRGEMSAARTAQDLGYVRAAHSVIETKLQTFAYAVTRDEFR
jgi:hypothetical protein